MSHASWIRMLSAGVVWLLTAASPAAGQQVDQIVAAAAARIERIAGSADARITRIVQRSLPSAERLLDGRRAADRLQPFVDRVERRVDAAEMQARRAIERIRDVAVRKLERREGGEDAVNRLNSLVQDLFAQLDAAASSNLAELQAILVQAQAQG